MVVLTVLVSGEIILDIVESESPKIIIAFYDFSMAVHPSEPVIATGQMSGPNVKVRA